MKLKSKVLVWLAVVLVGATEFAFSVNAAVNNYELLGKNPVKRGRRILYNKRRKIFVVLRGGKRVKRDSLGDTSLHNAVRLGHGDDVARLLSEPDIDVNARNKQGNTALHVAVNNGRWGLITYLVRHAVGLNFNAKNNKNQTPLDIAKRNGTEVFFRSCFPLNVADKLM